MSRLLIDIGNTSVHIAAAKSGHIVLAAKKPLDKFKPYLNKLIKKYGLKECWLCSVVPSASLRLRKFLAKRKIKVYECGREITIPVKNLYRRPKQVGQDRLINVYAASNLYKKVRLIIDLGTAVTFDFISVNQEYLGGLIFPGMSLSLAALLKRCALLPKKLSLQPASRLKARSTSQAISSGMILGYSFLIKGLIEYIRKGKKKSFKILITGGDAGCILPNIAKFHYNDPALSLKGLNILAKKMKNKKLSRLCCQKASDYTD